MMSLAFVKWPHRSVCGRESAKQIWYTVSHYLRIERLMCISKEDIAPLNYS